MIVFIDTNIYIKERYTFNTIKMTALQDLINNGKIILLYTKITEGEVTKHLKEEVTGAVEKYNSIVVKNLSILTRQGICEIDELDVEDSVTKAMQKLTDFLNLNGIKEIPLNPLDADKLLDDYFSQRPPFEKNKPNEFKDAIMINAIKNYQKKIKKTICIVSRDEGFRRAFLGNKDFIVFEELEDFLKYNKDAEDKITKCVEEAVEYGKFNEMFKNYLVNNYDLNIDNYQEWDCEEMNITDICCELLYIEEREGRTYASISCEVEILIDITYRDEDMSYYDKEERRYLFEKYIHAVEKHKANIDLKVLCDIEKIDDKDILLQNFEIVEANHQIRLIYLDDNTRISSEELDAETDSELNLEHCSQCNKILYDDDDLYQDYEGRTLCADCMKSDKYGCICPKCGRKIPPEYMISDYCKDCAQ